MEPYNTPASQHESSASTAPVGHCGIGITSFVMSILNIILMFIMVGIAGYLQATIPGGLNEKSPQAVIVGLIVIFIFVMVAVSIILSIVSLTRKNRKKIFGILGLAFNLLIIFVIGGLMAIGLAVRP